MRLIDADALIGNTIIGGRRNNKTIIRYIVTNIVQNAPTVDAVPVIRCKDCKFSKAYYHGSESNLGMFTYLCTQGLYGMNADDYCSRAERKEE